MNRRELLRNSLLAMGVLAVNRRAGARIFSAGEDAFIELERADWTPGFFSAQQNETVIALSDVIIPATDTPGAKAALVNRFLDLVIAAEPPTVQKQFLDSLTWFDTGAQERYQTTFVNLTAEEKQDFLNVVAWPHTNVRWSEAEKGFAGYDHFVVMKRWIVSAFYSSPAGLKEQGWDGWAARGTFTGCDHEPGEHEAEHKTGDRAE
jgi:Gluconate 2-dehydrogenase subunit 3